MTNTPRRTLRQRITEMETRLQRLCIDDLSLEQKRDLLVLVAQINAQQAQLVECYGLVLAELKVLKSEVQALKAERARGPLVAVSERVRAVGD